MLVLGVTRNNSCFSTGVGDVLCHDTLLSHQQIWTGIQAVDTSLCLHYKLTLYVGQIQNSSRIFQNVFIYMIFFSFLSKETKVNL